MATIALSLILASIVSRVWILENYDTVVLLLGDEQTLDFWWTLLSIVVVVGGAVTILLWFARAYRNLPALGAHELTYSPRSAVGWWFVPVVSMVAPLRVTIELFKASDPSTRPNGRRERRQAALPKLVVTWWIVFLAALILDRLPISSEVLVWFALLASLQILAAGLAIAVIWRIQLRQDAGQLPRQDAGQPVPQGRPSRLGLIIGFTGAGGCLGLIVLAAVLVVLFFQNAAKNCPPKDFPIYPGAQQTDFNYEISGATSRCTAGWESDAAPTEVSSFYEGSLTTGAWQLVSKDPDDGLWYFQRRSDGSTIGRMGFSAHGTQTRIEAEILTGQSPTPSASP